VVNIVVVNNALVVFELLGGFHVLDAFVVEIRVGAVVGGRVVAALAALVVIVFVWF